MSYKDAVLASKPAQYYTLDNATTGHVDLSGLGNNTTAISSFHSPIVPGYYSGTWAGAIPNPLKILSNDRIGRDFAIEFWSNPESNSGTNQTTRAFVWTGTAVSGVYFVEDRFIFKVTDSSGTVYQCDFIVPHQDGNYHVVASFVRNAIVLVVNGIIGYPTLLPDAFSFSGSYTTLTFTNPGFMSHYAVYNRMLTIDEIQGHYEAGQKTWDYRSVCTSDGADFYPMSSEYVTMAVFDKFGKESWSMGTQQNLLIDRDGYLTLPEQDDLVVYNAGVVTTPTYASNTLSLGTTIYAVKDDALAALSTTGCAIALTMTSAVAPTTVKVLLTIFNKNLNKYWTWYINSSNIVNLNVVQNFQDGTSTTATYAYTTAVANGSLFYAFWIEPGRVRLHSGGAATDINQYAGNDWIYEDISLDKSTSIIFGADGTFTGPSMDSMDSIYLWNSLPVTFSGDFTTLAASPGAAAVYNFTNTLSAESIGIWTCTFSAPYVGAYSGHAIDWKGNDNSGLDLKFSYNGSAYISQARRNGPIPNFPLSGSLGTTQVNGPFSVKATLTSTTSGQRPRLEEISVRIFANNNFKSEGTDEPFVSTTLGTAFAEKYRDPAYGGMTPTALFLAADRLEFPSQTYNTIEFVFISGDTAGEVLCARENLAGTERSVSITAGNLLNWTGFDAVYLNGVSVVTGTAITRYKTHHIIATLAAGMTNKINFGAHYDGTLNPLNSGLQAVALYDRVLTAAEITEHFNASKGLITGVSDQHDTIALNEVTAPYIYSYAWQMTGAPK